MIISNRILIDSLNNFLVDYCSTHALYYLDINSKLSTASGLKPEYSLDGTHVTRKAYEIWGQEISTLLKQIENKGAEKALKNNCSRSNKVS